MPFEFAFKCQSDSAAAPPYRPAQMKKEANPGPSVGHLVAMGSNITILGAVQQKPPTAAPKKMKGEGGKGKVGSDGKARKSGLIPIKYLQAWGPGQGCPSMACPGGTCHFPGKAAFQSHWLTHHRPKVQVYMCPAPACSKDFRRKEGLKVHYTKTHAGFGLGELDMARVATRQEPNDKYKRPLLPPSGAKLQPVASPSQCVASPSEEWEMEDGDLSFEDEEDEKPDISTELPATAVRYLNQVKDLHLQRQVARRTCEKLQSLGSSQSLTVWLGGLHNPAFVLAEPELVSALNKQKLKQAQERVELLTQFFTQRRQEYDGEYQDMSGLLLQQIVRHYGGAAEIKMKLIVGEMEQEVEENMREKTAFLHYLTIDHIMNTA